VKYYLNSFQPLTPVLGLDADRPHSLSQNGERSVDSGLSEAATPTPELPNGKVPLQVPPGSVIVSSQGSENINFGSGFS